MNDLVSLINHIQRDNTVIVDEWREFAEQLSPEGHCLPARHGQNTEPAL
jgi:hypothetical protein